jgi:hypothetical protein
LKFLALVVEILQITQNYDLAHLEP